MHSIPGCIALPTYINPSHGALGTCEKARPVNTGSQKHASKTEVYAKKQITESVAT